MKYITLTAKTYEDALKKARIQYGDKIRIHSRKDISVAGFLGLGHTKRCEVTFYTSDDDKHASENKSEEKKEEKLLKRFEQEAITPSPDSQEKAEEPAPAPVSEVTETVAQDNPVEPFIQKASSLLELNEFSQDFSEKVLVEIRKDLEKALPNLPDKERFELLVLDKIAGSFEIDYATQATPPRVFVILGTTGTGKTTTVAKISALYGALSNNPGHVKIITLDSFRIGAFEQIESFGRSLGVPVFRANDRESFSQALSQCRDSELILIDTIGKSPKDGFLKDKLNDLLDVCPKDSTGFFAAVNASMKTSDIEMALDQFSEFDVRSVIITKIDETNAVGNIISICSKKDLPILFVTDGQKVPSNIHRASNAYLMSLLKGFSADLSGSLLTKVI